MTSVLKVDDEEECSFLKIENVVSLAPRADINATESPIVSPIIRGSFSRILSRELVGKFYKFLFPISREIAGLRKV